MTKEQIDMTLIICSFGFWFASIALVLWLSWKLQKALALDAQNKLKERDRAIDEAISKEPLSDLVDLNNKDGKG